MSLLSRLERALGRFAIPDLSLYLVLGQVLFWSVSYFHVFDLERIALLPLAVRTGEIWRLVTFLLVPPNQSPVFIAFAWYIFYLFGSALEHHWGNFRYNAFIFICWLLTVLAAFLSPTNYASNGYIAITVMLAFAYLNPDFVMYIFFILPVKIKWLALIAWIGIGFNLLVGSWPERLMVLASVANFLIFFSSDIVASIRSGKRRMAWQAQSFAAQNKADEPRHRCHVCGKTDVSDPRMDFRYCSKCAGDECYCADHIFNHEHVLTGSTEKKQA